MRSSRIPRSVQIPQLKAAALSLAERLGEAIFVSNIPITEVRLDTLLLRFTPMGPRIAIEVWDESRGGTKVLNLWIADPSRSTTQNSATITSASGVSDTTGLSVVGASGKNGDIEVVSFRRGDWEDALLKKARQALH